MNTQILGALSLSKIISCLLEKGVVVSIPFVEGSAYDLVLDRNDTLLRAQCKTARFVDGCVVFNTYSKTPLQKERRRYDGKADIFLAYCAYLDKIYELPVLNAPKGCATLRVEPTKGGQKLKIVWAKDYEL